MKERPDILGTQALFQRRGVNGIAVTPRRRLHDMSLLLEAPSSTASLFAHARGSTRIQESSVEGIGGSPRPRSIEDLVLLPDDESRLIVDFFLWKALSHRFFRKVRELLKMDWLRPKE
jgi:hypothetical protein